MFGFRTHLIICVALFAALIVVPMTGAALAAGGYIRPLHGSAQVVMLGVLLGLFLAAGMSAVPVMVMIVLGTARQGPVAGLARYQAVIVWSLWLLIAAGAALALPAAITDGVFAPAANAASGAPVRS